MPKKSKSKKEDSKIFAFLAVFLSIFGFIIALLIRRDNKYVMFYAKQSLILFIAGLIVKIISVLLVMTLVGVFAAPILWITYIVLWVIALINSVSGKQKETPFIGHYGEKIDL